MHHLKAPDPSGGGVQSATTELACALSPGRSPPKKSGLALPVGMIVSPRASSTGKTRSRHWPRWCAVGARLLPRNRVPSPAKLAGSRIKSTNHTALHIHRTVIADRRTSDHKTATTAGGQRSLVVAAVAQLYAASDWICPCALKSSQGLPVRASSEINRASIVLYGKRGSAVPGGASGSLHADTPREVTSGIVGTVVDIRIILPFFGACSRIERHDLIEGCSVQASFEENGRSLKRCFVIEIAQAWSRARMIGPRDFELGHIP